jgi:hypothetical protein
MGSAASPMLDSLVFGGSETGERFSLLPVVSPIYPASPNSFGDDRRRWETEFAPGHPRHKPPNTVWLGYTRRGTENKYPTNIEGYQ